MKTNILILAANPIGTEPLQLEREINFIQEKLESSSQHDRPWNIVNRFMGKEHRNLFAGSF